MNELFQLEDIDKILVSYPFMFFFGKIEASQYSLLIAKCCVIPDDLYFSKKCLMLLVF